MGNDRNCHCRAHGCGRAVKMHQLRGYSEFGEPLAKCYRRLAKPEEWTTMLTSEVTCGTCRRMVQAEIRRMTDLAVKNVNRASRR